MSWRSRRFGALTVALAMATIAGCGGGSSLAALKDPGVQGVEALRQALRTALLNHDRQAQCELFAPILLDSRGGSVETCARSLEPSNMPYMKSASAYVAGGHIEFRGNEAGYMIPFGQAPSEDPKEFTSEEPQVAFAATYTEGAWRIVNKSE
jgi:hypothetical protein